MNALLVALHRVYVAEALRLWSIQGPHRPQRSRDVATNSSILVHSLRKLVIGINTLPSRAVDR